MKKEKEEKMKIEVDIYRQAIQCTFYSILKKKGVEKKKKKLN